ncbi:hypothetical protein CTAYLR_010491 [Chrysophaeum taylorii]|uniref:Uncharacterized protein n=1 Tax=Chrysophaeum taylorii TaxID=2483200 RepID=A0AAD7U966_9STRA|nr:hypothetical protein CTAYLR_010491 [Chrysophaeum taylorii]
MGRSKKKLVVPVVGKPMRSRREARRVTTAFHRLSAAAQSDPELGGEVERLRARYQEASALSTSMYSTSRWVLRMVRKLDAGRRLLEVGAVNTQLVESKLVETRAIDLRASHPKIERLDFFDVRGKFEIVVCSLVLNCVVPEKRGAMLRKLREHALGGLVFLVIPRSCVEKSRRMTPSKFETILDDVGFLQLRRHLTPKLIHLCLTPKSHPFPAAAEMEPPVERLRVHKPANDFDIPLVLE